MLSADALTPVLLFLAELLGAVREALTRHRQDQATALQPSADEAEAHIRALIAQALTRGSTATPAAETPAGSVPGTGGDLQPHADLLKAHIDALVAEALAHSHATNSGSAGGPHPGLASPVPRLPMPRPRCRRRGIRVLRVYR